jgi:multidrug efflux system outer membrane protein
MSSLVRLGAFAVVLAAAPSAPAQTSAAPAPAPAATASVAPSPLDTPPEPPPLPSPPVVDEAELRPPPRAARVLRSWQEALALARVHSPAYRAALDGVARAEAQAHIALSAVLPTLDASGSFTHQFLTQNAAAFGGASTTIPLPNVWTASVTAAWSVADPRAYYAIGTARREAQAATLDLAETRRTTVLLIVDAMLTALVAERTAELNRVGLRAALDRLALTRRRTALGGGTTLDVERATQDYMVARALVVSGDEALRQAREALGLALGLDVAAAASTRLDLSEFERAVVSQCRMNRSVEARPDVAAARKRLETAERAVNDVWLQFAPSIAVASDVDYTSRVLYGPATTWDARVVLDVPLWEGGVRWGQLKAARAARDQARQTLTATRLNAVLNILQSERAVHVSAALRDMARQQKLVSVRIDAQVRTGYAHGSGTSLDLVSAAQDLRQAELSLVVLEFQAARARVASVLANADCGF